VNDAVLIASFGGPEGPEEVMPFLERVAAGRGIPRARLEEVGQHYLRMGGRSPINEQNRALVAALRAELASRGVDVPVVLANRNSPPFFDDVLRDLHDAGHRRVLALATSMYSAYSSCRQYREDLAAALESTGLVGKLDVVKARPGYDRTDFIAANAALLSDALTGQAHEGLTVMFTTHSIPVADAQASGPASSTAESDVYSAQHHEVARAVIAAAGAESLPWRLVYQSRSGPPHIPWLEPDVNDALHEEAEAGTRTVVLVPIGFVSDHVEVIWDLDTEARQTAADLGLDLVRVPTVGTHPVFVAGLADHVQALLAASGDKAADTGWAGFCAADCCVNRQGERPTVAGVSA
jgi:protoporphyrin/coproporphyrin ferrochelatase